MAWPCRLLAVDLDGTLLRDDGEIAFEDRMALHRARARGVHVTIATGRLVGGAVPLARELGLKLPLICADGAATACPRTASFLEASTLEPAALDRVLSAVRAAGLVPFLLTPETIFGTPAAESLAFLRHWNVSVLAEPALRDAALGSPALPVVIVLAFGAAAQVRAALSNVAAPAFTPAAVSATTFSVPGTPHFALRVAAAGVDKASALARLAASLGLVRAEVAVVGDWFNDVPLFRWAGHSYAMGQAPEAVAGAAKRRLAATAVAGGGVAEVVEDLLASTPTKLGFARPAGRPGAPPFPER
jgi:hypothetical protein